MIYPQTRVILPTTEKWRDQILIAALRALFLLSFFPLIGGLINVVETYNRVNLPLLRVVLISGIYLMATTAIGLMSFKSNWPYRLRSLTLLSVLYLVGTVGLFLTGLSGDGRVFLFAFTVLTTVLFSRRGAMFAVVLAIMTLIVMAVLFVQGVVALPAPFQANSTDLTAWLSGILVFALLNTTAVVSISYLVRSLEASLQVVEQDRAILQRSEAYFRALIENSADAIALIDQRGNVMYASQSTGRVTGHTAESFVNQNAFDLVHPDDQTSARSFLYDLLQTPGKVISTSYRVTDGVGGWRQLEGSVHNLLHEPKVGALVINYRDVTLRRQAEESLRESEAHLQRLNRGLRVITEINKLIVREQEQESLLEQACQLLIQQPEYRFAWIGLMDEDGAICRFAAASPAISPQDYTFSLQDQTHPLAGIIPAIQQGKPTILTGPACAAILPNVENPILSALALPIQRTERPLGVWVVCVSLVDFFDTDEINLLQELANDLAYALENLQKEAQRHRRTIQQQALAETAAQFLSQLSQEQLLQAITITAQQTLDADRLALFQYNAEQQEVNCPYSWQLSPEYIHTINQHYQSIPGVRVLDILEPIPISDIRTDPRTATMRQVMLDEGFLSYVVFPLVAPNKPLGALVIYRNKVSQFAPGDLATGQTLAHFIAVGLQNAALFADVRKRAEEAETLRQVGAVVAATLERDKAIELILQQLARLIPYDSASVQLLSDGHLEIVGGRGWPDANHVIGIRFPKPGPNPNTLVMQELRPHIINSVTPTHGQFNLTPHDHIQSWLGVPLIVRERIIGMLAIDSKQPNFFTAEHARLVTAFADQVAVALENARLFEEVSRRANELAILIELSTSLRTTNTHAEIQTLTLDYALNLLNVEEGAIFAPTPNRNALQVVQSRGWPLQIRQQMYTLDDSLAGYVFTAGEPLISSDLAQGTSGLSQSNTQPKPLGSRTGVYVPLRFGNETIGILCIDTAQERTFTIDEVRLLTAVAEIAGSALHRASVMETLEQRVIERTAELTRANELLKELDRLKDEFVTNVNHELRTPLTNITMYLELLHTRGPQFLERYLPVLRRESKRLALLIEDMLTLSKLEQGRVFFNPEPYSLDHMLIDVLQAHEARIRARSLTVKHEPNPSVSPVPVDHAQMMQVFTNLLGNAIAYTPLSGEIECQVNWAREGTRYVEVTIYNSGDPIPQEELPHLFERFFRGKIGRESGEAGTGLGLAICQEIVARHGGTIGVESGGKTGTVFRITLPAY